MASGRREPEGLLLRVRGPSLGGGPEQPGVYFVRLGSFDTDPGVRPSHRQFVAYAASWEPIPDDGLPRYPERRPPTE